MDLQALREERRTGYIGPRYSGLLHLAFTSLLGLSVIAFALSRVHGARWELLVVPATFLYANWVEYRGHRGPMHKPVKLLRWVYERHSLSHHAFFTREAMCAESTRDFKMVLFPPALVLFFFGLFALPVGLVLRAALGANVAGLFVATAVGYFLTYEWLHLAYHLGERVPLIGSLRQHHAAHHDPALMSRHNFNITFPICDALYGTSLKSARAAPHTSEARSSASERQA